MDISVLTLKLILLLVPGAISCVIFEKLTVKHKEWTSFQFICYSAMFGGFCYIIAELIWNQILGGVWGVDGDLAQLWKNLPENTIPMSAIQKALPIAVVVGFAASAIDHHKIINKIAKFLKISTKYGDENLYSYFLNAEEVTEIYIRDIANKLTYHGELSKYAENADFKEILLSDVMVYNYETSEPYYHMDKVYLVRPKDSIIIELPFLPEVETENRLIDTREIANENVVIPQN